MNPARSHVYVIEGQEQDAASLLLLVRDEVGLHDGDRIAVQRFEPFADVIRQGARFRAPGYRGGRVDLRRGAEGSRGGRRLQRPDAPE